MKVAFWEPKPELTLWGNYRDGLELLAVLEAARARDAARVMLTGDAPPPAWFIGHADGWRAVRVFPSAINPAARYTRDGHTVEIRRAAEWFGQGSYSPADAEAAWDVTRRALLRSGRGGAAMFRSPGATGIDLWLRMNGGEVPEPLADDLQQLIRSTSPQHRIELLPPATDMAPALWVIDARWSYAALARELGSGPAQHVTGQAAEQAAADEYARGRYLVEWRAPDWWQATGLVGLLLSTAGDDAMDGWHAPLRGRGWVDAAELQLARRYDWQVKVLEAITYTPGRPLDAWAARLIRARDQVADVAERDQSTPHALAARAIRSVLLHAIGSFHATGRDEQAVTDAPMEIPNGDGWRLADRTDDGRAIWRRPAPAPTDRQLALRHPEWSAGVWGRAHARILESPTANKQRRAGALAVKSNTLVSIYGDAIITTQRPDWVDYDDGRPGRLRVKGHICGPHPWPTTAQQRDHISRAAEAAGVPERKHQCQQ